MNALERPAALLWLVAGFAIWSLAFVALYGVHAIGCERDWDARALGPSSALRLALVAVWLVHLGLGCASCALAWRRRRRAARDDEASGWLGEATFSLCVAATLATLWCGLPVVALPLCGGGDAIVAVTSALLDPPAAGR